MDDIKNMVDKDRRLKTLLGQVRQFQFLEQEIKKILPANLSQHFQIACVRDEGLLVLIVKGNVAASRLKMVLPAILPTIRQKYPEIKDVQLDVQPEIVKPQKVKQLKMSEKAVQSFEETAEKLRHHPELHKALCRLVAHQKEK